MAEEMKAFSIKVEDLASAVDKAVADVMGKHNLQASKGLALGPGTLIGRQLQAAADLATVQRAAADVTADVTKTLGVAKGQFSPAAIIAGGHIIVGFVAQGAIEAL